MLSCLLGVGRQCCRGGISEQAFTEDPQGHQPGKTLPPRERPYGSKHTGPAEDIAALKVLAKITRERINRRLELHLPEIHELKISFG